MRYSNRILVRGIFTRYNMAFVIACTRTLLPSANASSKINAGVILTDLIKCKVVPVPMRCQYAYDAPKAIQSVSSYETLSSKTNQKNQALWPIQPSRPLKTQGPPRAIRSPMSSGGTGPLDRSNAIPPRIHQDYQVPAEVLAPKITLALKTHRSH